MQAITLTTNHSLPALVVPPAKCLFDQRQQNLEAAETARGQEFRPETGLALGHIVLAGCLRYRALMTKHLPEVQFMYPLVPLVTVHTMNVLMGYRCA